MNSNTNLISPSDLPNHIFKTAVEYTFNHIIITDVEGIIIYANQSAERMTGYTFDEMKGNTPRLWGQQMDAEFYVKFWDTIKNKKEPLHGEVINKRKNGELYNVMATVSPIFDEAGELIAFIGLEEDITDQKNYTKNLEEQVELRTKELSQRVLELVRLQQEKNNFISSASHQLRTPAGVIKMQLELLRSELEKLPVSQDVTEGLKMLEENSKRSIDIMNDLFKIIEFGDGYVASDLSSVNLKKLLDSIFKSFEELVFIKKLQVVIDVADDFSVNVDESSFKYAILNLVDNAITYSNDEGEIKITATNTAETSSITIEDTGIGIPVEDQVFIFDKFFRAKNSYLKKTVGTGLGLSIVKIVAEGHDGEVSFASKEGEGTTFTLLLPEKR